MRFLRAPLLALTLSLALAACGDDDDAPTPVDAGTDLSTGRDASTGDDAATDTDASAGDDAGASTDASSAQDMCTPPRCPPIPPGCTLEPSADPCECGIIKCDDGGTGAMAGEACGGRAGPCGPGLFCNFTVDFDCGFADGMGVCEARPEVCSRIFMPVCGCDGVTYPNACEAQSMGTDYQSDGACPPAPDCREAGCPSGSSCMTCRSTMGPAYVCIPAGAAC